MFMRLSIRLVIHEFAIAFILIFGVCNILSAQRNFIYTKEGKPIMNKKDLVAGCLKSFHKDKTDSTAVAICECQISKLDRKFSGLQYRRYNNAGIIDIQALLNEDSIVKKDVNDCFTSSGKTRLFQAQGFESEFMNDCIEGIRKNTQRKLDMDNVNNFCSCQLDLIKTRKLSDAELKTLENPNSILFYEVMYKCGDPFAGAENISYNWKKEFGKDIWGPDNDTINILTLNGMSYIKIKTGNLIQYWLFDTGSSDLLIDNNTEESLKKEGLLTQNNYLGTGEYEMANGAIDTCRKYMLNNIQIGNYIVNNVAIAVTDKGKRIIVGKSLLNKFTEWKLDNEKSYLILNR